MTGRSDSQQDNRTDDIALTRRNFIKILGVGGISLLGWQQGLGGLTALDSIANPLEYYPSRDWEKVYLDQYHFDSSFTWICAPNDTHMCRMRAFVRNGVMIRAEQNYDHDRTSDIYGNKTTKAWNPRGCLKGYTFQRRVYGPYRLKGPVIRNGWRRWADAGFPSLSDNPKLRTEYKFDDRGNDTFDRVTWEEAARYTAEGLTAVAQAYSGKEGIRRLTADGYDPLMLTPMEEAGTRTMKFGSNLPIHGLIGKFGIYRFVNMLALLDHHVRGVEEKDAKGAREWNEYTWRGDQAPGTPFVTGLQATDMDFCDLRSSKLIVQVGKNLVENKMPESHWLNECMERGGKLVCITPDYSAPSAKSNYWIGTRPGLGDLAVLLAVARLIIEKKTYDAAFVKNFTDLPLLVRTDTLARLRPEEVIADYKLKDLSEGPSFKIQGLNADQRAKIGDFCVWDSKAQAVVAISRDEVGAKLPVDPSLEGEYKIKTLDGKEVTVLPVFEMYRRHLAEYDPATAADISGADPALIERLADDLSTIKPASIHFGEGVNHYFHATLHNRACFLLMMLTGNIGNHGMGAYTWAGNYKGAIFQASPWSGPGVGAFTAENPFKPVMDENATPQGDQIEHFSGAEEPSYWAHGEHVLKVNTPEGEKLFTGKTHIPTPTKVIWYNNANFINQAKWVYNIIHNVLPRIDMVVDQQIEWTGSAEYADIVLPANSWVEFQDLECGGSCSNPFLQAWGGDGIAPVHDSRDDGMIFALVANALAKSTNDNRFADYWKFVTEKKSRVYIQRVFNSCTTTRGKDGPYQIDKMMRGEYGGEPGTALFLFRTYPRIPFYEQVHDNIPFYTDCGRMAAYCDLPEAIDAGENLIVHREAVEATPYLPNVIVSKSPYLRPKSHGIPPEEMDADLRSVRNIMMPWSEAKQTANPLWSQGFRFFCSTPKSRHSVHSSWATIDWHWIWAGNHSDTKRRDKRMPGVGDRQIQMNPQAAKDSGFKEGDYVYVDANPNDRPYRGWNNKDFRYRAFRCMVRVKLNPALPYHFTIMKHTGWIATERTVKAHEARPDGRAIAEGTGYQSSYRYGSHQSVTRSFLPPMHQTDTLFHKRTGSMGFIFGFAVDNHAINTVPKETLIRVEKAEDGGIGGVGPWDSGNSGYGPVGESDVNLAYLAGTLTSITKEAVKT
ncbi:molybdopterin-dependent oxidoreductase [Candidatus Sumerlaeota bacterium]|nr:molybdopterin-dependent oxidoreductase [Candidatus Sumerlaeota bacterium]